MVNITVSFAPSRPGPVSGVLLVGEHRVPLEAEALEVAAVRSVSGLVAFDLTRSVPPPPAPWGQP